MPHGHQVKRLKAHLSPFFALAVEIFPLSTPLEGGNGGRVWAGGEAARPNPIPLISSSPRRKRCGEEVRGWSHPRPALYPLWDKTLPLLARRTRRHLLADPRALGLVIAALGGPQMVAQD